jgi:hypothetical protein
MLRGVSEPVRIYLEGGPKRTFAVALDWPGWARSGKGDEAAIETLEAYLPRYAKVLRRGGIEPPSTDGGFEVVDRLPATATTDFGALDKDTTADLEPLRPGETERLAAIVGAAWEEFDDVVAHAPAELRKGPRGGGRDRDKVYAHVMNAEASYIRKLGLRASTAGQEVPEPLWRPQVLDLLRTATSPDRFGEKGWLPRYAARRITWHVLDHAWEIEDRTER